MGDEYTIADIATWPWVRTVIVFYEAADLVGFDGFPAVADWLGRASERPASQKAVNIPPRG